MNTRIWKNLPEVKRANKELGNHWFEPGTLRFFNSKMETGILAQRYFVTSEYMEDPAEKRYTVRLVNDDGSIDTVGDFQAHEDIAHAKVALYGAAYPHTAGKVG